MSLDVKYVALFKSLLNLLTSLYLRHLSAKAVIYLLKECGKRLHRCLKVRDGVANDTPKITHVIHSA